MWCNYILNLFQIKLYSLQFNQYLDLEHTCKSIAKTLSLYVSLFHSLSLSVTKTHTHTQKPILNYLLL